MSSTNTTNLTAVPGFPNNDVAKPGTTITASLLTSDHALKNDMHRSATANNTLAMTLGNDVVAPTMNKTSNSTLEDGGLEPITTPTTATASDSFFPLHRLPRELQDRIHTYISFSAATWVGRPPLATEKQVVVIENTPMLQPATLIKTHSNIILVSKEVRDNFRNAVWRTYMESHRQVNFLLYDFDSKPLSDFFAGCSTLQLQKLQKKEKCLVNVHLTRDIRRYRKTPKRCLHGLVQSLVLGWVSFCDEVGLDDVEYSLKKCSFFDVQLVDIAVSQRVESSLQVWEDLQTSPSFVHLEPAFTQTLGREMFRGRFRDQSEMIKKRWKHC